LGDGKAVAGRVEIVSNFKFIDLSVLHQDFAFGRDDDGAIVDSLAVALGEAGCDVDSRLSCCCSQEIAVPAWDRLGQPSGLGVRPAGVKTLGQDHDAAALAGGVLDHADRSAEILVTTPTFNEHLAHRQLEPDGIHR
jgi:hypothetical protein